VKNLPVGIAYVTDISLLEDSELDFSKSAYVAIGIAPDTTEGEAPARLQGILAGNIGRFFGKGGS
jgi:hypothetical protein